MIYIFNKFPRNFIETERVKSSVGHTTLHKIVIVYRGMEMVVCKEI